MNRNPRAQRHIECLQDRYEVDYIGSNPNHNYTARFIQHRPSNELRSKLRLLLLKARQYNTYIWDKPNQYLASHVSQQKYNLIIVHHIKLLPVVFRFAGKAKIILDAHEYYTEIYNDSPIWNFFMKDFYNWISDNYLNRCDLTIAVNESMRLLYEKNFHIPATSITNASDYVELQPSEVDPKNIRIIHHGLASKSRKLELMIDMAKYLDDRFTLTFIILTSNYTSRSYAKSLKKRARDNKRIIFLDVLPQDELIGFCNDYDVGLFFMPPSNINEEYSLANKFFQYVQSRLMLAVSPLPEMKRLVEAYELGVVGDNYDPKAMAAKLNRLTAEDLKYYKNKVHESAQELSSDSNRVKFLKTVADLLK